MPNPKNQDKNESESIREKIVEELKEYSGTDFLVNDELVEFIENIEF